MRFLGQFECAGDSTEPAPDREGTQRSAIVFEFVLASVGDKPLEVGEEQTEEVDVDLAVVRSRALDAARLTPRSLALHLAEAFTDARQLSVATPSLKRPGSVRAAISLHPSSLCGESPTLSPIILGGSATAVQTIDGS